MEFCKLCDNMVYMKTEEDGSLVRYCKHCSFKEVQSATGHRAVRLTRTNYSEDELLYRHHQNPFLRFDPTLPRVLEPTLKCKNPECTESRHTPRFIYIKYHPVDMKYFYVCDHCGTSLRVDEKAERGAVALPLPVAEPERIPEEEPEPEPEPEPETEEAAPQRPRGTRRKPGDKPPTRPQ